VLAQAAGFAGSSAATLILGGAASVLLARALSTSALGSYSFLTSFLALVALVFEFGLFASASRLAALGSPIERRGYLGASLIAFIPVGASYLLAVWLLSFGLNGWFHIHGGGSVRLLLPLLAIFPFQFLAMQLAAGMDRLHTYSVTSVVSTSLFLLAIVSGEIAHLRFSVTVALAMTAVATIVGQVCAVMWLHPVFRGATARVRTVKAAMREYGLSMYVGRVLSIGTYNMDVLMVSAFTNASQVAFYNLAGAIAGAVVYPGSALGRALFPHLTRQRRIDRRWVTGTSVLGLVAAAGAALAAGPVIRLLLGTRYHPAASLVLPLAAAGAVRSVTNLYNSFLMAHGKGRHLRMAGFVLTGSNLVLNFALIPPFGALGAAWASFGALVANLGAHVHLYRKVYLVDPGSRRAGLR
jgi:O-antigen/teichoic acid export membrane protein